MGLKNQKPIIWISVLMTLCLAVSAGLLHQDFVTHAPSQG